MKLLLTLCLILTFFSCEQSTSNTTTESNTKSIDLGVKERRSSAAPSISGTSRPIAGKTNTYRLNLPTKASDLSGSWSVYKGSKRIMSGGNRTTQSFNFNKKYNGKRLTIKFKGSYETEIKDKTILHKFTATKSIIVKIKGSGSV